jgi:hypothetical protein
VSSGAAAAMITGMPGWAVGGAAVAVALAGL